MTWQNEGKSKRTSESIWRDVGGKWRGRKEPREEERGGKETVEEGEMISDEDDEKYEPGAR